MPGPVLDVRDLRTYLYTRWGTVKAVDGVSFTVDAGETLGLVGESGSGKSMTCLSILRLVPRPAARIVGGQVLLDGADLLAKSEREMTRARGKQVSMILQDPMSSLNPVFTVGMQVREPVALHARLRGRRLTERATELLASVGIPSAAARMRAYPHQLSGGMRQRVVGAMAIAAPPRLLIADEPTTSLDLTIQAQYLRLLKDLQSRHRLAMIFVTHDLGIIARMCDRVAVMYAGRIVEAGPVRQIFESPAHPYTRALLGALPELGAPRRHLTAIEGQPPDGAALPRGCAFHPRCPEAFDRCREDPPPEEVALSPDHLARCRLWDGRAGIFVPVSPAVVEADRLVKHFTVRQGVLRSAATVRAVDGVSFSIEAGKTLGLVGESGCGKTTTSKLVLGLEKPTSGAIRFEGRELAGLDRGGRAHYRRSVQAVFQDPYASLDPRMRVGAIVGEPLVINEGGRGRAGIAARVGELLDLVGLPARAARQFPHEFSGGQRQRVAIARALALSPRLVVLDEPVSALDVSIRAQILNLLVELQDRLGLAYLFIAHDLSAVGHMSHSIAVMYLGRIVEIGPAERVARDPRHPYARALFAAALPVRFGAPAEEVILGGEVPSPIAPPAGCHFHPRCPSAMDRCAREAPRLGPESGRLVACHLYPGSAEEGDGAP